MTSRRTLLASMLTLTYGVPVVTLAAAARLSADYDRTSSYGVLTVSAPGASKIRTHVLGGRNPVRYLIDIEGVKLTEELSRDIRRIASDRFVSDVRCGQYKPDTVRIVVEMKKGVGGAVLTGSSLSRFRVRFAEGKSAQITQTESTPRQTAKAAEHKPVKQNTARKKETICVVIDAGHGGADPGAVGRKKTYEKHVVLEIAKKLANQINRTRGMRAVLTRTTDVFIPLHKRAQRAVSEKAHLFVSVHADAWTSSSAHGASVFTLSTTGASSLQARWLAQTQNKVDEIGGVDFSTVPQQARQAAVDMLAESKLIAGLQIGHAVLAEMGKVESLHKDSVESAEFAVLKAQGIPSILIETGFLSNPSDESRLRSSQHQTRVAQAVCRGVVRAVREYPGYFTPKG